MLTTQQHPISPDLLFGVLFHDVQMQHIFQDSKTFADCIPNAPAEEILSRYEIEKYQAGFQLEEFVRTNFRIPSKISTDFVSDQTIPTAEHINRIWSKLTRSVEPNSSLLPVPYPYIVPGGRFRGLYYWDSYFTMLGLQVSGENDLIRGMVENFAYLIEAYGHIPNANRSYFLSRSQPPFFPLMLQLLAEIDGPGVMTRYLAHMQKEYTFWMDGYYRLDDVEPCFRRVALIPEDAPEAGAVLNRYWDDVAAPRPESYSEDVDLAHKASADYGTPPETMYRHIRAACESGWDFTSRWLSDGLTLATTQTTDIIPVDLNCLMYVFEKILSDTYRQAGQVEVADIYKKRADERGRVITRLFWDEEKGFFKDYNLKTHSLTPILSLAGLFPLYVGLATPEQASRVHDLVVNDFLQAGGVVTALHTTGQQWDSPNGWAPLQWVTYKGLKDYGFDNTASVIRARWLALNDKVFFNTGKMMEKYNVMDNNTEAGGGEYPNQDGFGWTNGIYLRLLAE
ncbi:alpha,alpha-trehalase TreF [Tellurirhabdus bombi]|uniref:alpha,alpha-trehalase TreF n=1 Tax=Tellurirhabdus bombi TaxID=2907205 RepID=UPI001F28F045|nr:alpha,alpha-trehalase TreF [Tellurirhabdus bombi]